MIVGRTKEKKLLHQLLHSPKAEFLAVYGRRRVGKTYLIHESCKDQGLYIEITGSNKSNKQQQLKNFHREFSVLCSSHSSAPKDWSEAFDRLLLFFQTIDKKKKIILFFDELPWLASPKSGFLSALDYFWNRHFSRMENVFVIICGSAASWMIQKVINDKGGLYGRLSAEIRLLPFSLSEVEEFLLANHISMNKKSIIELYMVLGGVAKYWTHVIKGLSPAQIINQNCFTPQGPLFLEFSRLYQSLFDNPEKHINVVKALAKKRHGLTQIQLLEAVALPYGGSSSLLLAELEASGFICSSSQFGNEKKEKKFRLIDEYSYFYLSWIEKYKSQILQNADPHFFQKIQPSSSWATWAGYTFENICLKHMENIKKALGISAVSTIEYHWSSLEKGGAEIDLLIDRADNCINLCEIKFCKNEFEITASYAKELARKKEQFLKKTKSQKNIFITLITPYGAKKNSHYLEIIDQELTMENLF
ncbi:MAG: ATP-binding protein [Chlamydiota bacterium]